MAAYLQRSAFSASTTPTNTDVDMFIEWSQGEIERKTNQAFQAITVSNEFHTIRYVGGASRRRNYTFMINKPYIVLTKSNVRAFTSGTDYIYVWNGSAYTDWVANKTEGRDEDYYVDYNEGVIYFMKNFPVIPYSENVKVTYRYGESTVPSWAEELCTLMAAKRVLEFDYGRVISSEGGSGDEVDLPRISDRIAALNEEITIRLDENRWLNRKKKPVIN